MSQQPLTQTQADQVISHLNDAIDNIEQVQGLFLLNKPSNDRLDAIKEELAQVVKQAIEEKGRIPASPSEGGEN